MRQGTAVAVMNHLKQVTYLSGSTDYFGFMLGTSAQRKGLKDTQTTWRGSAQEYYRRIMTRWALHSQGFVIVEAKSPLVRLETHLPQAIAEAVAL